ncbi:hypothetical protein [Pseudogemmobacter bohemicus]|uniref:hypothetical protein n=1 Tax=Pseudogemmobacter bohemicus TaxID=2250708 RepID=UPI000DD44333|nr:hypothetical protein [Pseudogemmobacter bohemicus]
MDADLLFFLALTVGMGLFAWQIGWLFQGVFRNIPLILAGLALFGLAGFFACHWVAALAAESNGPDPDRKSGVVRQVNALLTIAILAGPWTGLSLGSFVSRFPGSGGRAALAWAVLVAVALPVLFRWV